MFEAVAILLLLVVPLGAAGFSLYRLFRETEKQGGE
jgi:hypothetical protein